FFDFQNPFALQHHREDETGRAVFQIVLFEEFAQQRFRGLLLDRLSLRGRHFEDALPMRDESFSAGRADAVMGGPATFADIEPSITGLLVEQDRVIGPFVRKRPAARLTGMTTTTTPRRAGQFRKVGENLYRYSSNEIYYAVFRVNGKLIWKSLETEDRELAKRKLKEELEKHGRVNGALRGMTLQELITS